jgi:hypothetical protein
MQSKEESDQVDVDSAEDEIINCDYAYTVEITIAAISVLVEEMRLMCVLYLICWKC